MGASRRLPYLPSHATASADVELAALMVAAGGLDYDRDTTAGIEKALQLLMPGMAPEGRLRTHPQS
jgi:hypothetical protein